MKGPATVVSIADVASLAGVSPTTVSHALSGKRPVSSVVHERVMAAMDQLGYTPSRAAQSLASGRTRVVGLVVPDIGSAYFAELAKGVERAAVDAGYNVLLCTTGFDHEREVHALEMIRSRAVDGVIYAAGAPPTGSELTRLLGGLPLVLVDEEIPGASATVFASDNEAGGRLSAEHLLALGHRRAVILEANAGLVSSESRVRGFTQAWATGGGEQPAIAVGGFTDEGGRNAIRPLLSEIRSGEYTAIFAVNDLMALGAAETISTSGISIPSAISIVGFDDILAARYAQPPLTTVRQSVSMLGGSATEALLSALESTTPLDGRRHILPVELVVRASTTACASTQISVNN